MNNLRDNEFLKIRLMEIEKAKKSIVFFQQSILEATKKNEDANKVVEEQTELFEALKQDFFEKNNIAFEDAKILVESSFNPEKLYNLKDFDEINNIYENINEEKIFIHYRNNLIKKNENYINDATKWIKELEINIQRLKNRVENTN